MRILHYVFGLPPFRTGGLIDYATELAVWEKRLGNEVSILYPGTILQRNRSQVWIKENGNYYGVPKYIIINPLPIPLTCGIKDIDWFMHDAGREAYEILIDKLQPDVVHVHSLMGIHKSFFTAVKERNCRIVFTTHDYFGLCPTSLLLKDGTPCADSDWINCKECCTGAFGTLHLKLDQFAPVQSFMSMRSGKLILGILERIKGSYYKRRPGKGCAHLDRPACMTSKHNSDFEALRKHYLDIFALIDFFHFNSEIAKEEYEKRISVIRGKVIPLANSYCQDNRTKYVYENNTPLRIGYLGTETVHKGYYLLKEAVEGIPYGRVVLNTYFKTKAKSTDSIVHNTPYNHSDSGKIMRQNDIICMPSIWKETFGFALVEALSYGVPVILSSNVGAKVLVDGEAYGVVIDNISSEALKKEIMRIAENRSLLQEWNGNICKAELWFDMIEHTERVMKECYETE